MNCPWCGFHFKALAANAETIPEIAPLICESCGAISLLIDMVPRKPTAAERAAIEMSPAWRTVLGPVSAIIRASKAPPVDRTQTTLSDGSPVTPDFRELLPNGMQRGYIVLSDEERAKGFVRPYRDTYTHVGQRPTFELRDLTVEERERYAAYHYVKYEEYPPIPVDSIKGRFWTAKQLASGCGTDTTMGRRLSETYARDPEFYGATFCCQCGTHFLVAEFIWKDTEERVGS